MDVFKGDKTYFVGIGVQKAGSTWLHDYFSSRPDTLMSPIKELHYFDAEFRPDLFASRHNKFVLDTEKLVKMTLEKTSKEQLDDWANDYLASRLKVLTTDPAKADFKGSKFPYKRRLRSQEAVRAMFQGNIQALRSGAVTPSPDRKIPTRKLFDRLESTMDRALMAFDPGGYVKYFDKRVRDEHVIFGEVTPSYALLRQDGFEQIRKMNKRTKIILLLRDPVDRFYSLLRMRERRKEDYDITEEFRRELRDPLQIERGMYQQTYADLRKIFRAEDVYIDFFEKFFSEESLRVVCDFLSVPFMPGQYEQRVNAAPTPPKPLPPGLRDEARKVFGDTYAFAKKEFGSRVPAKWLT